MRKSVRRATPDGDGEKKRQKSLPAHFPDALFRLRTRFLSILASRPGPENRQKTVPKRIPFGFFCGRKSFLLRFLRSGAFRKGPGPIPEAPEALPDQIFKNFTMLFCWFLRFFFAGCVPILSGFVGLRRDVAGIRAQPQ